VEPLPRRTPVDVFTEQLPVQAAVDPAPAAAQRAVPFRGPAPLFDPDRAAAVDPAHPPYSGAAVELAGDELADELAAQCPGRHLLEEPEPRSSSGWFEPSVPGGLYEDGSQVPPPDALRRAADFLAEHRMHDAAAWCDTWAAVAR
jgi:hypothetical protein